jgi:hypothetical protein
MFRIAGIAREKDKLKLEKRGKMEGYSLRIYHLNKKADGSSLGVKLGRVCIERNIPVADIANALNVSRQTIYNWFVNKYSVTGKNKAEVVSYLAKLNKK